MKNFFTENKTWFWIWGLDSAFSFDGALSILVNSLPYFLGIVRNNCASELNAKPNFYKFLFKQNQNCQKGDPQLFHTNVTRHTKLAKTIR